MSRRAREMQQLLYPMKRRRGEPVQIHKININTVDLQTGDITKTYSTYRITKAIVLPVDTDRKFVYDLAYIASNKNFTEGGFFDKLVSTVIIDINEIPTGIVIILDDYCSISGVTYTVAASAIFEGAFYILKLITISNFASLEV